MAGGSNNMTIFFDPRLAENVNDAVIGLGPYLSLGALGGSHSRI